MAKYINKKSDTQINFVYETNNKFENGEIVNFSESGVSALYDSFLNDKNIIKRFKLQNGQKETIYDLSRIVRRKQVKLPI